MSKFDNVTFTALKKTKNEKKKKKMKKALKDE